MLERCTLSETEHRREMKECQNIYISDASARAPIKKNNHMLNFKRLNHRPEIKQVVDVKHSGMQEQP